MLKATDRDEAELRMRAPHAIIASLIDDTRGAFRHLARAPVRSGAVVAILTIGIGLNTALFSVVHSVGTRPATGIPSNDRVVRVRGSVRDVVHRRPFDRRLSLAEVDALREHSEVFSSVAAWTTRDALVSTSKDGPPVLTSVALVTPGYFEVLGVRPSMGRSLGVDDTHTRAATPAIIAHELWTTLFGQDPSILGRDCRIDDGVVTIIGVAPPGFHGPNERDRPRVVWLPLTVEARTDGAAPDEIADDELFSVVARLTASATAASASAVAGAVAAQAAARQHHRPEDYSADIVPLLAYNEQSLEGVRRALAAVTALALITLLIVSSNVAALLAGSAIARRSEFGVRLSLGAGRTRIAQQLLIESLLLAMAGGVLGVSLILAITASIDARLAEQVMVIDWAAVLVTLAVTGITGVASGVLPAFHASRARVSEALVNSAAPDADRANLFLQRRLVVLQVAVTQPLLLGIAATATLVSDGARGSGASPIGDEVLVVDVDRIRAQVGASRVGSDAERFLRQVRDLPEVSAIVSQQGGFSPAHYVVGPEDRPGDDRAYDLSARSFTAAPGFFELMDMPILRGRGFNTGETNAVIIGSDLARTIWGSADPIGRRLYAPDSGPSGADVRVVGVLDEHVARRGARGPGWPVWVPPRAEDNPIGIFHTFYVRTKGSAKALIPTVTRLLREEAPELTLGTISTLSDKENASQRVLLGVAGIATGGGLLALLLASVGLYASAALAVRQRTREVGIRVALGARSWSVQWLFLAGGLRLSVSGVCLGLPLSLLALRWFSEAVALPGVLLGSLVAGSVIAVTSMATWVPARRAASLDPNVTLKAD